MKAIKKHIDPDTWAQLTSKIKEADETKRRDMLELQDEINLILGKKDLKITIPKDSKALNSFRERAC